MLFLLFLFLCTQCTLIQSKRQLPTGNIIIAYVDNCDDSGAQALAEARAGVNVLIWSFISNLDNNQVHFDLDSNCIAQVAKTLREEHLPTTHLVSIGGWDAPHPNTTTAGEEWWTVIKQWNRDIISKPALNFSGFDGIDWDLEGNDTPTSQWNMFTQKTLDLMGTLSKAAHDDGFIVTLVPPESYFDVTTSSYDRSLTHPYPEPWHPEFLYHGRNVYTFFDLIDIQLYESYSHATYYIDQV